MRRLRVWMVAACLATPAAWVAAMSASAAECPALDYQATLTRAAAALQQSPPDVVTARSDVATLVHANPSSSVALQPVLDDLSTAPPEVDDAQLRLTSMSATLAFPRNSTCNVDAGAARSALHDVYGSAAFKHLDDSNQSGLLDAIRTFLISLFRNAAGALGPIGAVLLVAAVLGVAALLAWRRWRGSAAFAGAAIDEPATAGDDPDVEWRLAERAAAAGDHREAVRRAFRSALIGVAGQGLVHLDAAWTTRELLQRCRAGGDVLASLAAAASLFERAWYSGHPVTAADWQQAAERCGAVRRAARHPGLAPR